MKGGREGVRIVRRKGGREGGMREGKLTKRGNGEGHVDGSSVFAEDDDRESGEGGSIEQQSCCYCYCTVYLFVCVCEKKYSSLIYLSIFCHSLPYSLPPYLLEQPRLV